MLRFVSNEMEKMDFTLRNVENDTNVRLVKATDEAPRMRICVMFCNAVINMPLDAVSPLGCNRQCNSVIRTD